MQMFPWYSQYEQGVPHEINVNDYESITDILNQAFKKFGPKSAFTCMGKTITYRELDHLSRKFAAFLQKDLRLNKGDTVALMMPNILQYPVALYGILRAGLVAVNVNPLYTARELEHQLNDSGAQAIIIFENSCSVLSEVIQKTKIKNIITTEIGDMLNFPKSVIVNMVIKHVKKMVPKFKFPIKTTDFNSIIKRSDPERFEKVEQTHEDIAFLQYTGGTTGISKGVILKHKNIIANILQAREWIKRDLDQGEEIIITPLPLYHIFSLTANCFIFSSIGGHNILITNPRDIPGFIKELKKYKFSAFTGLNTLFNALLNNPEFKNVDFSGLKLTLGGGMAVQESVAKRWKEVTGCTLVEAYGLTETSPAVCINPLSLSDFNGNIGLPIPSTEVVVLDDQDNKLGVGQVGEISVKGPQVMDGYWNHEKETQKVMSKDGYFKTGDIGLMDEKGYFKIVDRKKDMILVSGFNVYPNEIEDILSKHPKILESAAIGVSDAKSGEVVKVFVVKRDESLTQQEVDSYCKDNLTGYKRPKHIEFTSTLPKSNVGKILRRKLKEAR